MDILSTILCILLGVVVLDILQKMLFDSPTLEVEDDKPCTPHKWEYDHLGSMVCSLCKFYPEK